MAPTAIAPPASNAAPVHPASAFACEIRPRDRLSPKEPIGKTPYKRGSGAPPSGTRVPPFDGDRATEIRISLAPRQGAANMHRLLTRSERTSLRKLDAAASRAAASRPVLPPRHLLQERDQVRDERVLRARRARVVVRVGRVTVDQH